MEQMCFQNWSVGFGVLHVSRNLKWYCKLCSFALVLHFFLVGFFLSMTAVLFIKRCYGKEITYEKPNKQKLILQVQAEKDTHARSTSHKTVWQTLLPCNKLMFILESLPVLCLIITLDLYFRFLNFWRQASFAFITKLSKR